MRIRIAKPGTQAGKSHNPKSARIALRGKACVALMFGSRQLDRKQAVYSRIVAIDPDSAASRQQKMFMVSPGPRPLAFPPTSEFERSSLLASKPHGEILSVERDHQLLATRAKVLGISGRKVVSATPQQSLALLASQSFQLIVLGHTLSDGELAALAALARSRNGNAGLLMTYLHPRPVHIYKLVDRALDSWAGPSALVGAIQELLTLGSVRQAKALSGFRAS